MSENSQEVNGGHGEQRLTGEGGTDVRHLTPALSPIEVEREGGAQGTARPTLRLGPVVVKAREKMTVRELADAARDHQAGIALEAEVREVARLQGVEASAARKLGEASRAGFRIVNGEPFPVEGDRQSVLLGADGVNVMSVQEWVERKIKSPSAQVSAQSGEQEDEVLPMRNPFRRKTWNLTEQMRLKRRDPKLARRLKAEVWAAGED